MNRLYPLKPKKYEEWECLCGDMVAGAKCRCGIMLAVISSKRISVLAYNIASAARQYDVRLSVIYAEKRKNIACIYYKERDGQNLEKGIRGT